MTLTDARYDYDFEEGDEESFYVIFEVSTGKVVDRANDEHEAREKIEKLEAAS